MEILRSTGRRRFWKEGSEGRQRCTGESIAAAVRMKETSAVIIAERGQTPGTSKKAIQEPGHGLQPCAIGIGSLSQNPMKQEHAHGINVIIARPLEMASIRVNLAADLCLHYVVPDLFPAVRMWAARQQNAQRMRCNGFCEQMSVRRKIIRKVVLEIPAVLVQGIQKTPAQEAGHVLAHQMKYPSPGKRPERYFKSAGPINSAQKWIPLQPTRYLTPDLIQEIPTSGE